MATARKAAAARGFGEKLPLTIAIFCAGAPNLVATGHLLDRLGVPKGARLTDLRYRGAGWPGLMQARWRDGSGAEQESEGIPYAEGWGRILQTGRRWRCRVCADHTGAFADISVGDPWHNPPAGDTDAGRSLIVARTPRGKAFVEAAIRAGVLVAEPRPRDVIARAQPNLAATHGAVTCRSPRPARPGPGPLRALAAPAGPRADLVRRGHMEAHSAGAPLAPRADRRDDRMTLADALSGPRAANLDALPLLLAAAVIVSLARPLALGPGAPEPLSLATGHSLGGWAVLLFFFLSGLLVSGSAERRSLRALPSGPRGRAGFFRGSGRRFS